MRERPAPAAAFGLSTGRGVLGASGGRLSPVSAGAAIVAVAALAATLAAPPRPLLLWNASASSPLGLYVVGRVGRPTRGEMVVAWPPPAARKLAAARRYLPATVPLVKPVAAVAGDRICAIGARIIVNGHERARRRQRDPSGRALPHWTGCRTLACGEIFLLSPGSPEAFDGRYFGVSRAGEIVGTARLLWRR